MLMQMLEAGGVPIVTDHQRQADLDNPKGYFELERVKELDKGGDKTWLSECRGQAIKIISSLLRDLPPGIYYRIIFVERDIDEVIASQNKMLRHRGEEGGDIEDHKMKMNYHNHLLRVRAFLKHTSFIEALFLRHRDAIDAPLDAARRIQAFLGVRLDVAAMAAVVDGSLYRNRVDSN